MAADITVFTGRSGPPINSQQTEPGLILQVRSQGFILTYSTTKCMVEERNALKVYKNQCYLPPEDKKKSVYFPEITVFFTLKPSLHFIIEEQCVGTTYPD